MLPPSNGQLTALKEVPYTADPSRSAPLSNALYFLQCSSVFRLGTWHDGMMGAPV